MLHGGLGSHRVRSEAERFGGGLEAGEEIFGVSGGRDEERAGVVLPSLDLERLFGGEHLGVFEAEAEGGQRGLGGCVQHEPGGAVALDAA